MHLCGEWRAARDTGVFYLDTLHVNSLLQYTLLSYINCFCPVLLVRPLRGALSGVSSTYQGSEWVLRPFPISFPTEDISSGVRPSLVSLLHEDLKLRELQSGTFPLFEKCVLIPLLYHPSKEASISKDYF